MLMYVFELNVLLCIYTSISQNQFNLNSHIKHLLLQKLNLVKVLCKSPFKIRFMKKKVPRVGLEPTKVLEV